MIVPNLTGIAKAVAGARLAHNTTEITAATTPSVVKPDYTTLPRRRRGWGDFDLTSAFFKASGSPGRSIPATSTHVNHLAERQTCASGLTYYACANGFKGCCAGNPCNSNTSCSLEGLETSASSSATSSKTGTATKTTKAATSAGTKTATGTASKSTTKTSTKAASGTATATGSSTGTAVTTTQTTSSSATSTPTVSSTSTPKSGGSNVGAIAGGVVGGVVALVLILALLALLVRRHRKKVDARREGEKLRKSNITAPAPDGRYYATQENSGHHRSGSTSNDAYTPQGGFPYGHPAPSFAKSADHFSELEGHSSKAPGVRAEGGPSLIPAAILRPPQMLDSTPVGEGRSSSRSSVFVEHMSEMEDTSFSRPSPTKGPPPQSPSTMDSPVLGRTAGTSTTSLADDIRRKEHALYWNNYGPDHTTGRLDEGMSASLMPKAPPSARITPESAQISPDPSGYARGDSSSVVSPLRYTKYDRGSESTSKESEWDGHV